MELIFPEGCDNLEATGKEDAIEEMIVKLASAGLIATENVKILTKSLIDREQLGSTGIMNGVGVPHVRHEKVVAQICAIGKSDKGIAFDAMDGQPVYLLFMILAPKQAGSEYLTLLVQISMLARKKEAMVDIRNAKDRQKMTEVLKREMAEWPSFN